MLHFTEIIHKAITNKSTNIVTPDNTTNAGHTYIALGTSNQNICTSDCSTVTTDRTRVFVVTIRGIISANRLKYETVYYTLK